MGRGKGEGGRGKGEGGRDIMIFQVNSLRVRVRVRVA